MPTRDMLRFTPRSEIEAHIAIAGYMLKEFDVLPQRLQLLPGHVHLIGTRSKGFGELDDAVGLGERKRAEQHSVHNCEYCRIRADSECQRQNSDDGEPRTLRQHADRITKVLPDGTHPVPPGVMLRRALPASPRRCGRQTGEWYARRNLRNADRA